MQSSTYNNGVSDTRAYNADNTLASINFAGADVGDLTYGWDDNKNKTSEDITGTMSGYGFNNTSYDDEDRLVSWNRTDNALSKSWNLSLVGDWDSVTENGTLQDRTHGPTHEMLTAAGEAISTDTRGNMTSIPAVLRPGGDPLNLTWDFDNRMSSADIDNDGTDDVSYQFDALGRRVANDNGTTTTVYVQSGQQTIADYASGAAPASPTYTYYYASYIDEPVMRAGVGALRYYHRGQQYSVTALTDSSGNVTERYAYTAYGTPTITDAAGAVLTASASNNRCLYTGREWDEKLSLYHYRARMYDAYSGRFLERDPIDWLQDHGTYTYCRNDPTRWTDHSGFAPTDANLALNSDSFWDDLWEQFGGQANPDNCIKISRAEFESVFGGQIPVNLPDQLDAGCTGLCSYCQTCGGPRPPYAPADAPNTYCYGIERKGEPIEGRIEQIKKATCPNGLEAFWFIVEGSKELPVPDSQGQPYPKGTVPYNPGVFNYITMVGNYCISLNHGVEDGDQVIRICKGKNGKPPVCGTGLRNRMLCLTCREDCASQARTRVLNELAKRGLRFPSIPMGHPSVRRFSI